MYYLNLTRSQPTEFYLPFIWKTFQTSIKEENGKNESI